LIDYGTITADEFQAILDAWAQSVVDGEWVTMTDIRTLDERPSVTIVGAKWRYVITDVGDGLVGIDCDGEGGHFSAVEFAEMIGRFVSERL
jgi:hypothetical protein